MTATVILIRITPEATAKVWQIYGPIVEEGVGEVSHYSTDELLTILGFLRRSRELQERHRARIAAQFRSPATPPARSAK